MTKIKTYTIKSPIVGTDKWIGSNGLTGETKNFSADGVSEYVRSGMTPIEGGVFKTTEIEIETLDTDIATTVNAMSPSYTVASYEQVWFIVDGLGYVLKNVDLVIGDGGETLTNSDFITLPVNTGQQGATGNGIQSIVLLSTVGLIKTYRITYTNSSTFDFTVTDGSDGTSGTNGLNADMTKTSTTSLTISGSGSKTATYAASANLGWLVGTRLRFANNASNYMEGAVTAVSSTSVTITVDNSAGSGTFASWNIGIAGDKGASDQGAVVYESTSSSLTITLQQLEGLDYDLSFEDAVNKVYISGKITNNTGATVGITNQDLLTFVDSNYGARLLPENLLIGSSEVLTSNTIIEVTPTKIIIKSALLDTESVNVNGYYFKL